MSQRHIYGIEWNDNLAWMEYMSGPRWEALVKQEETLISEMKGRQEGQGDKRDKKDKKKTMVLH